MYKTPVRKFSIQSVTLSAGLVALLGLTSATADDATMPTPHSDGLGAAISDTVTTIKVKGNLMSEDSLDQSDIGVTTTNGVVTLNGSASGSNEKELAESTAKTTGGVESVDNNITTPSSSSLSDKAKDAITGSKQIAADSWITTKVKSELLADSLSKGFEVGITTLDGVVILTGELDNADAIDHVKDIAGRVTGVKSVDVSALTITSADDAQPQPHSDGLGTAITDTITTAKVKGKVMNEDSLDHSDIGVTTTNGVVTLDGSASGSSQKELAETTAMSTNGVKSVDNNLTTPSNGTASANAKATMVETNQVVSDSWITTKVKSELLADSISKGFKVGVTTKDGVVILKGELANSDAIDHVKDIAGNVNGVKSVEFSALTIKVE